MAQRLVVLYYALAIWREVDSLKSKLKSFMASSSRLLRWNMSFSLNLGLGLRDHGSLTWVRTAKLGSLASVNQGLIRSDANLINL